MADANEEDGRVECPMFLVPLVRGEFLALAQSSRRRGSVSSGAASLMAPSLPWATRLQAVLRSLAGPWAAPDAPRSPGLGPYRTGSAPVGVAGALGARRCHGRQLQTL